MASPFKYVILFPVSSFILNFSFFAVVGSISFDISPSSSCSISCSSSVSFSTLLFVFDFFFFMWRLGGSELSPFVSISSFCSELLLVLEALLYTTFIFVYFLTYFIILFCYINTIYFYLLRFNTPSLIVLFFLFRLRVHSVIVIHGVC